MMTTGLGVSVLFRVLPSHPLILEPTPSARHPKASSEGWLLLLGRLAEPASVEGGENPVTVLWSPPLDLWAVAGRCWVLKHSANARPRSRGVTRGLGSAKTTPSVRSASSSDSYLHV